MNFVIVLLEGLLSFFSPCIIPVLPIYFSMLLNSEDQGKGFFRSRAFKNTLGFVLGISTTFFIIGLSVSWLQDLLGQYQSIITLVGGILIVIMGLWYLGVIQFQFLQREKRMQYQVKQMNAFSAYLLGFSFSFGWTPCVGPMLASVAMMAVSSGSSVAGGVLIFIYTLGFVVPFILMALFYNRMVGVLTFIKNNMDKVKIVGGIVLILAGGSLIYSSFQSGDLIMNESEQVADESANLAPSFELQDQNGVIHSLSDYEGKVVYLTFWATWCSNCRRELPVLDELYTEYGQNEEDVVILTVASPGLGKEGDTNEIQNFIAENGYELPVLMDEGGYLMMTYGVRAVPTNFIIDREGNLVQYIPGAIGKESIEQLIDIVREDNNE